MWGNCISRIVTESTTTAWGESMMILKLQRICRWRSVMTGWPESAMADKTDQCYCLIFFLICIEIEKRIWSLCHAGDRKAPKVIVTSAACALETGCEVFKLLGWKSIPNLMLWCGLCMSWSNLKQPLLNYILMRHECKNKGKGGKSWKCNSWMQLSSSYLTFSC